jgi:hypothetical protein
MNLTLQASIHLAKQQFGSHCDARPKCGMMQGARGLQQRSSAKHRGSHHESSGHLNSKAAFLSEPRDKADAALVQVGDEHEAAPSNQHEQQQQQQLFLRSSLRASEQATT